jgi:hypothetical protein
MPSLLRPLLGARRVRNDETRVGGVHRQRASDDLPHMAPASCHTWVAADQANKVHFTPQPAHGDTVRAAQMLATDLRLVTMETTEPILQVVVTLGDWSHKHRSACEVAGHELCLDTKDV